MDSLNSFPKCNQLLTDKIKSLDLSDDLVLKYEYKFKDIEFLDIGNSNTFAIVYEPLKWYKTKNPDYRPLVDVNPQVPEYATLICQFIKDLLVLLTTQEYPKLSDKQKKFILMKNKLFIEQEIEKTQKLLSQYKQTDKQLPDSIKIEFAKINELQFKKKQLEEQLNDISKIPYNNIKSKIANHLYRSNTNSRDKNIIEPDLEILYKISYLLSKIEKLLTEGYPYKDVIYVYLMFIHLFSYGELLTDEQIIELNKITDITISKNNQRSLDDENLDKKFKEIELFQNQQVLCYKNYKLVLDLLKSPYFVYPSFSLPNYYKTLQLMRAPIINVFCSSYLEMTHKKLWKPCLQIEHDIFVHARFTHYIQDEFKIENFEQNNMFLGSFLPKIKANLNILKLLFALFHEDTILHKAFFLSRNLRNLPIYTVIQNMKIFIQSKPEDDIIYMSIENYLKDEIPENEIEIDYNEFVKQLVNELFILIDTQQNGGNIKYKSKKINKKSYKKSYKKSHKKNKNIL